MRPMANSEVSMVAGPRVNSSPAEAANSGGWALRPNLEFLPGGIARSPLAPILLPYGGRS